MFAEERKRIICELLEQNNSIKVSDLSKRFNITGAAVRKDLDELQSQRLLRRVHGGAVAYNLAAEEHKISQLATEHMEEKRRIAIKAYDYIDSNDTVLLDGSSTVQEMVKLIAAGDKTGITVLTNADSVVRLLAEKDDITVIRLGGRIIYRLDISVGKITESAIRNVRVDKSFLGINGIDVEYGLSIPNMEEAAVKREMIRSSKQTYMLADYSKFRATYLAKVADLSEVDYLITDRRIPDFDYSQIEENVQVVFAQEE